MAASACDKKSVTKAVANSVGEYTDTVNPATELTGVLAHACASVEDA